MKHFSWLAAIGLIMILRSSQQGEPLGIRNNNAGNIRATGSWQQWQGAVDKNKGFIVFDSAENGLRALARVLRTYRDTYQLTNIQQIISRWAPPNENNTQSYIDSVSASTGIESSQPLGADDYPLLMAAIVKHENGKQPYTPEQLYTGFERGFA